MEQLAQLECSYCGGNVTREKYCVHKTLSFCMVECLAGYLAYIENCGDEDLAALEKEHGRKITLPPPPQRMTHWDPEGEYDQEDLLVMRLEGLALEDKEIAETELADDADRRRRT
jgi:hypothetical protein